MPDIGIGREMRPLRTKPSVGLIERTLIEKPAKIHLFRIVALEHGVGVRQLWRAEIGFPNVRLVVVADFAPHPSVQRRFWSQTSQNDLSPALVPRAG